MPASGSRCCASGFAHCPGAPDRKLAPESGVDDMTDTLSSIPLTRPHKELLRAQGLLVMPGANSNEQVRCQVIRILPRGSTDLEGRGPTRRHAEEPAGRLRRAHRCAGGCRPDHAYARRLPRRQGGWPWTHVTAAAAPSHVVAHMHRSTRARTRRGAFRLACAARSCRHRVVRNRGTLSARKRRFATRCARAPAREASV